MLTTIFVCNTDGDVTTPKSLIPKNRTSKNDGIISRTEVNDIANSLAKSFV